MLLVAIYSVLFCLALVSYSLYTGSLLKILKTRDIGAALFLTALAGLFLANTISRFKYIILNDEGITFINALLPFLQKKRTWSYYDYHISTTELLGLRKEVWLIRNGKIEGVIYERIYSNYEQMKSAIKTPYSGSISLNIVKQIAIELGLKNIKSQKSNPKP